MGTDERRGWSLEWWIPAVYAVASGAWIYLSDLLVAAMAGSIERQRAFSSYKGFGFVLVTAVLLHTGLRWALRRERAGAERAKESEALLRAITSAIPDPIFLKGRDGRWLFTNPAMLKIIGKPMDEVIGYTDAELFGDEALSTVLAETDRRIMASGVAEVLEETIRGNQGCRTVLSSKAPYRDTDGRVIGLIGNMSDITERKRIEKALRESEALCRSNSDLLRSMLESSPDMVAFALDRNYRYLAFNTMHKEVIKGIWGKEIALGMDMLEVIGAHADREVAKRNFDRALAGESFDMLEAYGDERLSREYWQDFYSPIRTGGGEIIGLTCYVLNVIEQKRDMEERHRLQAQLQLAQQMESLGRLAGGVAHDMNNVLGAILATSSSNLEAQPAGSPAYHGFETISKAATRGGEMVKRLLNLARRNPVEERELDMNLILHENVGLLEHSTLSKIHLEMDLEPGLRPIRGDAGSLAHAFMNLCVNAVDAMPENGTLTLRSRNVDDDGIEIQVQDTGCGMPKEVLERALDPFFTTKEQGKGTGLGLSMVYSTVKAHRGHMEIRSEPGKGTCVSMRFPACQPEPREQDTKSHPSPRSTAPSRALNVLLVDDDELIQSSMEALLELKGHIATSVSSGEEALASLEAGLRPDVVILDMNMPGLGGAGTLPRIRQLRPDVPILLATGRPDQTALDLVETQPGVSLLSKPFTIQELQAHLEAIPAPVDLP